MPHHTILRSTRRSWSTLIWVSLLLAGVALRFYRVELHPMGMDYDQVREAYLASTLFANFQVVVDNLMFLHLASLRLVQLVFGLEALSTHIHAACWFTLTLWPLYWLTRDLFGQRVARWGMILLSFSVIGFTSTRVGHIPILVPFFAFAAVFAGERLLRTGLFRYAIGLGAMLAVGIFTFPTFKGVFLVLIGAALSTAWLSRSAATSWRAWRHNLRLGRAAVSLAITSATFLGVVWGVGFRLTGDAVSFQRLNYLLFGYKSNGRLVSNPAHFVRNGLQILSQVLPTRFIPHPHFLIPRTTGYAEALFYISPLIAGMVGVAIWSGIGIIRRLAQKRPFSQFALSHTDERTGERPAAPLISPHGLVIFWRKEYDWLWALWILCGGWLFAMLADHTAARRWIFSWFWLYPLAAAGIARLTRNRSSRTMAGLLGVVLLSQMALVYYPYLFKPWRMQGPTPSVIATMNAYCRTGYHVYATPMLNHWARHYQQITPLENCGYDIVSEPIKPAQLSAPYAVFDIGDLYRPVKFAAADPTIRLDDPARGVTITQFRDAWGFYDFKVTEALAQSAPPKQ